MKTFKSFSISAYKTEDSRGKCTRSMVVLNARGPLVGDPDTSKSSTETGLQYLSFFMTIYEFNDLMDGRVSSLTDCSHNVRSIGSNFMFYDMEYARDARGVLQIPYACIDIPSQVCKILKRAVRMLLRNCPDESASRDRPEFHISMENRERWSRQYGIGKGKVEVVAEPETIAYVEKCKAEGDKTFLHSLETVTRIARNTTSKHTESGKLHMSKYSRHDGEINWCAYTPQGVFRMNGGIIDHGKDGNHDWSVHT